MATKRKKAKAAKPQPTPAKMGRPTKLTPALQAELCGLLEQGEFLHHAALLCGITRQVVHNWLAEGAKPAGSQEHQNFLVACERARAIGERVFLDRIVAKSANLDETNQSVTKQGDWKADQWRLVRMNRRDYGDVQAIEVSGPDGGPVEMQDAADRVSSRIARLAAAARTGATPS